MDPATLAFLASIVNASARAGQGALASKREKGVGKKKRKMTQQETLAEMLESAYEREVEGDMRSRQRRSTLSRQRSRASAETANLVREAFNL